MTSILKILAKKYVEDILLLLDRNEVMNYTDIWKTLVIDKGTLSKILKDLEDEELVYRLEVREEDRRMPRVYYKLTPYGKEIVKLCKQLDNVVKNKQKLLSIGDNNINIQLNNTSNSNINIKK
ncbi:MarR family transcriptional regulator [Methanocaldococcus sp. 10A]